MIFQTVTLSDSKVSDNDTVFELILRVDKEGLLNWVHVLFQFPAMILELLPSNRVRHVSIASKDLVYC